MSAELSRTLRWGKEVERSLVAIVWHHPHFLWLVRKELDPADHFTLPAHRYILDAISVVCSDHDNVNWHTVVQAICEMPGAFEECGGKEGLNQIFTDDGHCPQGPCDPEPFVAEYIRFLKACAIQRGIDPGKPVLHYTVARGILQLNKLATKPEHPTITGKLYVPVPGTYSLAGWPQGDSQVNIKGQLERSQR